MQSTSAACTCFWSNKTLGVTATSFRKRTLRLRMPSAKHVVLLLALEALGTKRLGRSLASHLQHSEAAATRCREGRWIRTVRCTIEAQPSVAHSSSKQSNPFYGEGFLRNFFDGSPFVGKPAKHHVTRPRIDASRGEAIVKVMVSWNFWWLLIAPCANQSRS